MRKYFENPEVSAFEFSPEDAIMASGEGGFAMDPAGTTIPGFEVNAPSDGSDDWA